MIEFAEALKTTLKAEVDADADAWADVAPQRPPWPRCAPYATGSQRVSTTTSMPLSGTSRGWKQNQAAAACSRHGWMPWRAGEARAPARRGGVQTALQADIGREMGGGFDPDRFVAEVRAARDTPDA